MGKDTPFLYFSLAYFTGKRTVVMVIARLILVPSLIRKYTLYKHRVSVAELLHPVCFTVLICCSVTPVLLLYYPPICMKCADKY